MSDLKRIQPAERLVTVSGSDPALVSDDNPGGEFEHVIGFRGDINAAANIETMASAAALSRLSLSASPTNTVADLAHCFHRAYHQARDQPPRFTRARFGAFMGYAFLEIGQVVSDLQEVLRLDDEAEPGEAPDPQAAEAAGASE